MSQTVHTPVLLNEVITYLPLSDQSVVVDATLGGGGHTEALCQRYHPRHIIAIDQDEQALKRSKERLEPQANCTITYHLANFGQLEEVIQEADETSVDGYVFDLGLSSDQLEAAKRGFSFQKDEPLLMTYAAQPHQQDFTAREIINEWDENVIADILFGYGEERYARRIAKEIVTARTEKPIETTHQLVAIVERVVPASYKKGRIHPATRTFQALRIATNRELEVLEIGLQHARTYATAGGRIAVISFHSIEDRVVKQLFRRWEDASQGRRVTKKPIVATDQEIANNPRSRSAKLRVFEVI